MNQSVPEQGGDPHQYNEIHRFFEYSIDLFGIVGSDGYLKRINPAWERALGYSAEELLARPTIEFVHPDDRAASLNVRREIHEGVPNYRFENRYICKDGSVKWLEWTAYPHPTDELNYVVGRDVTERKRSEAALRESEARFRNLADAAPVLIWMSDADKQVVYFNRSWVDFRRVGAEQDLGYGWQMSLHPDDVERVTQEYETAFDARAIFITECRVQGSEGEYRWVVSSAVPRFTPDHELLGYVGTVVDIHDRKLTEQKLRSSEQMFRSVLESAVQGIILVNASGEIILLNAYAEAQFGYDRDELLGRAIEILIPDALGSIHRRHREAYLLAPETRPMGIGLELMGRYKDGSIFPVEVSLSYMDNTGELLVMAFVSDISDRKQIEQERLDNQRMQLEVKQEREIIALRQQFMSMVSHEFRTPLTVIASSSEILQHYDDRLTRDKRMEKLQVISAQVRTMVTLLDDILALNKIQAGVSDFTPEALDLLALCMSVLNNVRIMDQDRHEFIFDSRIPSAQILADRRLLEHSITNLLSNAVKYSPPESTIYLSLQAAEKIIELEVRDQGIGIPEEDQKHLFEPFYRARNARTLNGTGLGLAIVKHNIEQHGGTITCESAEGQGTTFAIRLPKRGTA